ncbi:hypothetical protein [Actinomadura sp. 9N407]|uniref:hypothetical protein n=1 Tax=Actinomadura sp. 9N407 TaxID=3375154 RepID=UPI0037ABB62D
MVIVKRILAATAAALAMVVGVAGPASAAPDPKDFQYMGNGIWCPLPWLSDPAYGPLSWCSDVGGDRGGTGWYGPYSSGVPAWANKTPINLGDKWACVYTKTTEAGGGVKGVAKTVGHFDAGAYGDIDPGVLYSNFGLQPIGRPGHATGSAGNRTWHATGDWRHTGDYRPDRPWTESCSRTS